MVDIVDSREYAFSTQLTQSIQGLAATPPDLPRAARRLATRGTNLANASPMAKQNSCRERPAKWRECRARHPHEGDERLRPPLSVVALLGILVFAASAPLHAEWLFDADAGALYDSNLSRASERADVRSGTAATLAVAARWFTVPSASDGLTVGAAIGGEVYGRYHGLDNGWAAGSLLYRHKFGIGLAAPWVLCELAASYFDYDVKLRTGSRFTLRAELGERFGETLDAEIGGFLERRYAPYGEPDIPGTSGDVFNLRGQGGYLRVGYAVTEDLLVSARLALRRGDVVSTSSETARVIGAATAIAEDPTFGDELYDYRLRGTTRTGVVTASWAVDNRSSLNLSYSGESTSIAAGLHYRSNSAILTYSYRY